VQHSFAVATCPSHMAHGTCLEVFEYSESSAPAQTFVAKGVG